jgi:Tfp pilus assembly protein PilX
MKNVKIKQRGSVLIVLIITMLIMGTLGTSMYLLTTTSTFGSLFSNKANRALLLAESGIRYAQKGGTLLTITLNNGADQINITNTLSAGITTINSTGIADANSFWSVRRKLTYVSGAPGGTPGGTGTETAVPMSTVAGGSGGSTGTFAIGDHQGNPDAMNVTGVKGNVDNPQSYPEAYGAPTWTTNPFCQPRINAGNYLSYDFQLKVSEVHQQPNEWNSGTTYHFDDVVWYGQPNNYLICTRTTCTNSGWGGVVFVYNLGGLFRLVQLNPQTTAYGLTFFRSTRYNDNGDPIDGVDPTMFPGNLNDNHPAIVLFSRDGGANNGEQNKWLAYKELTGTDYVVDAYGFLKYWNTIVVRVIEAASIKLSTSTALNITIGDLVTGGTGSAKIIRQIKDGDGQVVLLLNNVSGSFTSPVTVGSNTYATASGWGDPVSVPSWQHSTLYHVGDLVQRNSINYKCILEHTSSSNDATRPPNATYWESLAVPSWQHSTLYHVGDWVQRDSINYECILQHTSSSDNATRPPNATYWRVGTPPSSSASFYRVRDNYIWAFFADTDNHTNYDATATNNTRKEKDLFPADLTNYSPTFPVTNIQTWASATDDFTLVQWATGSSNLNTSADSSLKLMGKDKEENAIIRTNKWVTTSYPTSCAASTYPPEIGIVAKGTVSMQFAYDDLAYRILWGAGGGGGGTPSAGYYSY